MKVDPTKSCNKIYKFIHTCVNNMTQRFVNVSIIKTNDAKPLVCFSIKYLILLFPFISIHLKSTVDITAHQLRGIVYKWMYCKSAIERRG